MKKALFLATLLVAASSASAQTLAFVGARVIDGRGGVTERATIIVRDGKIAALYVFLDSIPS